MGKFRKTRNIYIIFLSFLPTWNFGSSNADNNRRSGRIFRQSENVSEQKRRIRRNKIANFLVVFQRQREKSFAARNCRILIMSKRHLDFEKKSILKAYFNKLKQNKKFLVKPIFFMPKSSSSFKKRKLVLLKVQSKVGGKRMGWNQRRKSVFIWQNLILCVIKGLIFWCSA